MNIADNVPKRRIPAARQRIEQLHTLRQDLRKKLQKSQEKITTYYDRRYMPKQFKVSDLVKLSTRHLKLKDAKLAPR